MIIRKPTDILSSEITDQALYLNRRNFMRAGLVAAGSIGAGWLPASASANTKLPGVKKTDWGKEEKLTPYEDVTTYNNFYEFGVDKSDPSENAGSLKPSPWSVVVDGEVAKPGTFTLEDILKPHPLEERIYRLRCVEAWSMVVPWVGFSLADLVKRFQPTSKAKFVVFETLFDPKQMPGQSRRLLEWPYREALRMDEAMNPLAILAVGLYGEVLPNQNGAPLRLVVPWKYGFKNIKSIVKISFLEEQPPTTWNLLAPKEYGFYGNVNPKVDHPRWSQANERRLGEIFRRETMPFNGYGEQVASLYQGMDPSKLF